MCAKLVINESSSSNLIKVSMNAFLKGGGIVEEDLSKELMCFGVDGVYVELVKWWRWNIKFKNMIVF